MANVTLFIGTIRPLPETGRPTGMYKQPVTRPLRLESEGFVGDEQADRRVHGGPEKAVHLYPSAHYRRLAERFPDAAPLLVPGSLGENIATADLDENDVRLGDIWRLGEARLQICQPRNPCWKIDERFASEGMALYISEQCLTGWYWRVLTPGLIPPDARLQCEHSDPSAFTLAEAMKCWQEHRPALADLERIINAPGIASNWREKIVGRMAWLRKNA